MQFTIFTANCTGKASNCDYPNKIEVTSGEVLQEAVKKDHVCASYKENFHESYGSLKDAGAY